MQVFFPPLKLCQTFTAASYTNLPIWVIWGFKYALSLSAREETNLELNEVMQMGK